MQPVITNKCLHQQMRCYMRKCERLELEPWCQLWSRSLHSQRPRRPCKRKRQCLGEGGEEGMPEMRSPQWASSSLLNGKYEKAQLWGYLDIKKMEFEGQVDGDEGIPWGEDRWHQWISHVCSSQIQSISKWKESLLLPSLVGCVQCHVTARKGKWSM